MATVLYFNFDGTDNEPADAMQDKNLFGAPEDCSITNILKFHLLLGGNLKGDCGDTALEGGSRSFYFNGVGTYGNFFERKVNAGLSAESADVSTILRRARRHFKNYFLEIGGFDYVVVTGFSRGGALARRFAAIINGMLGNRQVVIEGIMETVASIGLPNLSTRERPRSDVVFEHGHTLPSNVLRALHLVALDDKRKAFQPTLMNQDERVLEVWFSGAHSDVGGGYNFDGLSDNTLRFFLDWFEDQPELDLHFLSAASIDYENLVAADTKIEIGKDDMQIDPNPLGVNHQQDRNPVVEKATLTDRVCCVIREDSICREDAPLLHWTVAHRIGADRNYRPMSLKNTAHQVLYQDMTLGSFVGYSEHQLKYKSMLRMPDEAGVETRVYSHLKHNRTGIYLLAGKTYVIEVLEPDTQRWRDGGVHPVDGEGWDRGDIQQGFFREAAIASMEPFRRVTGEDVKWFGLCGCIGDDDDDAFYIGNILESFTPDKSGEFTAFANDLNGYYGNNSGYLKVGIRLIS